MPNPKQVTHFCQACRKEHSLTISAWVYWRSKPAPECDHTGCGCPQYLYWCDKGIDCAGCGHIHRKTGISKLKGDKWFCSKWFKKTGNGQIDWSQWSPQDVMSGVPYGLERDKAYGPDTEDHSIVHGAQVQAVEQALDELEESMP